MNGCGVVTLDNPDALNAWTQAMQRTVAQTVRDLDANPDVRSIVITGAGDRAFCSGQDLNELTEFTSENVEDWLDGFAQVYDAVLGASTPVVAALNGVAAGSGYQLALVCDLRVAHDGVRIGQPEVKSGIPSITGMYLTWQSLGHAKTAELMLTGRLMDAAEAHRLGLIAEICAPERVLERAIERAGELASQPAHAFTMTKRYLHSMLRPGLQDAFAAALDIDKAAYSAGEPQDTAGRFLSQRAND
ncbi:enoyl-CoA hydratase/isomerase family protein [Georgenia alba]|uniref:Enoyl-CoA hydratase/isomerase family protein n=1 Tax=Georgenia alba TaxID=2233858 RepID=A0ABW2QCU4_9MICO